VVVPRDDAELPPGLEPTRDEDEGAKAARLRGFIGLGVGGAFLIAGGVTGVMSLVQTSDIEDRCAGERCPRGERDAISRANTLANLSNVGLALGVVGVGYGLFELLVNGRSRGESERARLSVRPAGPGVQVVGRW
jgi:hypothetical protein